jgi:hypothetical protein
MRTVAGTGGVHGTLATENPATGAVALTMAPNANLIGADWQSPGDTLYALGCAPARTVLGRRPAFSLVPPPRTGSSLPFSHGCS